MAVALSPSAIEYPPVDPSISLQNIPNHQQHQPGTAYWNTIIITSRIRRAMAPRKKAATPAKAPKTVKAAKPIITAPSTPLAPALPPSRVHQSTYHYPLLFSDRSACDALLSWFEGVEETRSMPWRKKWVDPKEFESREEELGRVLSKRAYEVWVSEVSK
jgi:hypothetical protein